MMFFALLLGASTGCGASERAATPPPVAQSAPVDAPAPATKPLPAPVDGPPPVVGDPAALYADCETRVEGSDKEGECSADADCVAAGCSKELCISTKEAESGVMSTCEMRPCFTVLETCGCDAGRCRWRVGG